MELTGSILLACSLNRLVKANAPDLSIIGWKDITSGGT